MKFLLDTNVLSEPARPRPNPSVVRWLQSQVPLDLAISILVPGEIKKGVLLLAPSQRRNALERWLASELPRQFLGRLLPVDLQVALAWGQLSAEGRRMGRELPAIDGLMLATARVYELTLVTRNESDCAGRGVEVLNPWSA